MKRRRSESFSEESKVPDNVSNGSQLHLEMSRAQCNTEDNATSIAEQISVLFDAHDGLYGPIPRIIAARLMHSLSLTIILDMLRLVAESMEGFEAQMVDSFGTAIHCQALISPPALVNLGAMNPTDRRLQQVFILPSSTTWNFTLQMPIAGEILDKNFRRQEQDQVSRNTFGAVLGKSLFRCSASPVYRLCLFSCLFQALNNLELTSSASLDSLKAYTLKNFRQIPPFTAPPAETRSKKRPRKGDAKKETILWFRLWIILLPRQKPAWILVRLQKLANHTFYVLLQDTTDFIHLEDYPEPQLVTQPYDSLHREGLPMPSSALVQESPSHTQLYHPGNTPSSMLQVESSPASQEQESAPPLQHHQPKKQQ